MEKVKGTENSIEVFENDIEMCLKLFQEEQKIDDMRTISQAVWNGFLMYTNRKLFKGTKKLIDPKSTHNAYNYILVDQICDVYMYLCTIFDKEISINGFMYLTGIDNDTITNWGYNNNIYTDNTDLINIYNNNGDVVSTVKASTLRMRIYKKLINGREESLNAKLATGNKNPVGIMAILNHYYGWNMPGVKENKTAAIEQRTPDEIGTAYTQNAITQNQNN